MADTRRVNRFDDWHMLSLILEEVQEDRPYLALNNVSHLAEQTTSPHLLQVAAKLAADLVVLYPKGQFLVDRIAYMVKEKTEGRHPAKVEFVAALRKMKHTGRTISQAERRFDAHVYMNRKTPEEARDYLIRYYEAVDKDSKES